MELRKQSQMARTIKQFAGIAMSFMISSCKKDHNTGMLFLAPLLGGGTTLPTPSSSQSLPQNSPPSSQATPFPTGVSATGGNRTVTVTWGAVSGATSYNLYWSTTSGVTKATGTKITGVTSPYAHTALTNGTDYYYIVTAVGSGGESAASSEVTAYPYLLPLKTYQTTSYAAGDDGAIQAGRITNFTGPVDAGGGEFITTDNDTGLICKTCSEGLSGANCAAGAVVTMDWITATGTGTGCDALNGGAGFAGKIGWRLPTLKELDTITNYGTTSPFAFATQFPGTISNLYWSATPYQLNATLAWYVTLITGTTFVTMNSTPAFIRCVTQGAASTPPSISVYIDNGDGTVTDKMTSLNWQKCSMGQNNDATCSGTGAPLATTTTWTGALTYCAGLTLAGRTWRLPNLNELKSIADRTKVSPAIDTNAFPATIQNNYWSSTTDAATSMNAWSVSFTLGTTTISNKISSASVRCVSSGP